MDDLVFKLRITAYSPETIPMGRLAQYMLQIAALMGSESCVHFKGLNKGSTVLNVEVEEEDLPKVSERLALVNKPDAPADVLRPFKALNDLLYADNARATLRRGSAQIIAFPGCDIPKPQRIGPVKEAGLLEGTIISVGGKDDTKHIRMLGADGEEYKLTTRSIELAKDLGSKLFSAVRVTGMGTWFRGDEGHWELEKFVVESCEPLADTGLMEAVKALRDMKGDGWANLPDPIAAWHELRRN